jgi:FkbM family methyltransferase
VTRASKLARIARHPQLWPALRAGVAASLEHERVPLATPGTVLDVGASVGQFALLARLRWPSARIVSFEPLPAARERYGGVLDGTDLRPFAVGARPGKATLHVAAADDSSSLLPIGQRQLQAFPGTEEVERMEVAVVSIDDEVSDELPKPWLLKIDVQGSELEVLRGATRSLASGVGEVYVECSFAELYEGQSLADEVVAFLLDHGLRLAGAFNVTYHDGEAIQADLLFRLR